MRVRRRVEELERESAVRAMSPQTDEERAIEALQKTLTFTFDGLFSRSVL